MASAQVRAVDEFFATLYETRPVDATFIGVHHRDHRLPDWSPAGHERALGAWHSQRAALAAAQPGAPRLASPVTRLPSDQDVSASDDDWSRIDLALAASHCDITVAELAGAHFSRGNPSLAIGEAAFSVIGLITRDFMPAVQRASWLLQRLRQMPGFLAGALLTLRESPAPRAWRERALEEARATGRLLDEGVPCWCTAMALPTDLARTVSEAAQMALGGVHAFAQGLEQLAVADHDARPCGEEMLELCVRRGHWLERPIDHLLAEARDHFVQERAILGDRVQRVGARDVAEVQERLAARHPAPDDYYRAFGKVWDACRRATEEHRLVTWPDAPIRYVPIPEWTRMAAPSLYYLFYRSPAPFDSYPVYDYVVAPINGLEGAALDGHLRAWNDSVIKLNHVVHHGALGHHVQNWHAYRAPSRIGRVAAADCASRIAMLQGGTMAEGWACYATDLMDEIGFLTPDESVAEQHTRVRMLARAVVDLEFHSGRRAFDDCVRFYVAEVRMSPGAARAEVVKNSMFPATAMMYWIGTHGVHDLRRELARRLGSAFDLRAFHDAFLGYGAIPVAMTSRLMLQGVGDGSVTV
ncbi:MAG: DUF885 family protein [Gemmatimonadaceae bacterium]